MNTRSIKECDHNSSGRKQMDLEFFLISSRNRRYLSDSLTKFWPKNLPYIIMQYWWHIFQRTHNCLSMFLTDVHLRVVTETTRQICAGLAYLHIRCGGTVRCSISTHGFDYSKPALMDRCTNWNWTAYWTKSRTTDTQLRHKSKISEKLGRCGRQNMLCRT